MEGFFLCFYFLIVVWIIFLSSKNVNISIPVFKKIHIVMDPIKVSFSSSLGYIWILYLETWPSFVDSRLTINYT